MCGYTTNISSSEPAKKFNLNKCFVNSVISIGCGFAHSQDILNNLPQYSQRKFSLLQNQVFDDIEISAIAEMKNAAEEEKYMAIEEGNVGADGTWAKRSYKRNFTSKSGAAAIIGFRTKKVLYLEVKNQFCIICNRQKDSTPKAHQCFKNNTGPSKGMEANILCEGFQCSEEMYGLRFTKFIADGDSIVHKKILESFPYRTPVEKIECRNHLMRNFR